MSFVNRLPAIMIGQGTPTQNDALFLKQALVLTTTNQQTNVIPASANFTPTISKGKVRAKFYAPSTSGANPAGTVDFTLYDGTNFVNIGRMTVPVVAIGTNTPSGSIPNYADRVFEFETDINGIQLFVESTLTGTNPQVIMDVEISGTV